MTIWATYKSFNFSGCGLMLAAEPWSGHYVVGKSIWVMAHTTQFARPGWQYLDGGCGFIGGDRINRGSYVALKSPDGHDYSVIIETTGAKADQTIDFRIAGALSHGAVHVFATNLESAKSEDWFIRQPDTIPANGTFSITLKPGHLYSLTTTKGQTKGHHPTPPPSATLPLPYRDDFQSYDIGQTPRFFSDQTGAFEIAKAGGGLPVSVCARLSASSPFCGMAAIATRQRLSAIQIGRTMKSNVMSCLSSPVLWRSSVEQKLTQSNLKGMSWVLRGYHLRVSDTGKWSLICITNKLIPLATGTVSFSVNTWHTLKLKIQGNQITAIIDGVKVAKDIADKTIKNGHVGLDVSQWQNAQFQNFQVFGLSDTYPK